MKIIVVNNPVAQFGGALSILRQFIESVNKYDLKNIYYIFTSLEELKKYEKKNIKIVVIKKQRFLGRLYWDYIGLKKYCKKNNINPNLIISLQNTGVLYKGKEQLIYEHQSLIFSDRNWSLFKKQERRYWFYKNIYPFFIKFTINKNTKIITQTLWMKEKFQKLLKNKEYKSIEVYAPNINLDIYKYEEEKIDIDEKKINIFYPASSEILKNHRLILEILKELKRRDINLLKKIRVYFTFDKTERKDLLKIITEEKLEKNIIFLGNLKYNTVINYYKKVDLMIFPSIIESFPLPLIEAATLGVPILAANEIYSKFLKDYEKISYCELQKDLLSWIENFYGILDKKNKKGNFKFKNSGWKDLIEKEVL